MSGRSSLHRDVTSARGHVGGRTGALIKEFFCKLAVWGIRREATEPGSIFWSKGGRRLESPPLGW